MEIKFGVLSRNSLEKVLSDAPKCTKMPVFGYEYGYEFRLLSSYHVPSRNLFRGVL